MLHSWLAKLPLKFSSWKCMSLGHTQKYFIHLFFSSCSFLPTPLSLENCESKAPEHGLKKMDSKADFSSSLLTMLKELLLCYSLRPGRREQKEQTNSCNCSVVETRKSPYHNWGLIRDETKQPATVPQSLPQQYKSCYSLWTVVVVTSCRHWSRRHVSKRDLIEAKAPSGLQRLSLQGKIKCCAQFMCPLKLPQRCQRSWTSKTPIVKVQFETVERKIAQTTAPMRSGKDYLAREVSFVPSVIALFTRVLR